MAKLKIMLRCKPMDAEECEPFTDVYWIKFYRINNARFAKRKLDESVFLGNRLQVSYAPQYESLSDTKDKLEGRRKEVLARLNPRKSKVSSDSISEQLSVSTELLKDNFHQASSFAQRESLESQSDAANGHSSFATPVSSDKEYFQLESINQTVRLVREKLNKIQSSAEASVGSSKRTHVDNRRRI